ncbi:MAG TPA: XRE family transcriptional regulator [Desulfobulbaceae bacterium]|nr:XRE family transcriptional regulator [Desulfobulbaceae bacterium]
MPNNQIEDELAGLEACAEQKEDYVDFDPADYVDNPVALARMKAQIKQVDLARHMRVTQSYISKLEHADQVSDEALQKVKAALQELRKR